MPWVYEASGLNYNEKHVLGYLTYRANNQTRRTWVSVGTIARECGYSKTSRNTVRNALRGLRDKGLISYEEQQAGQGEKQSSNTYTVHWGSSTPGADSTIPPVPTAPPPDAESTTNRELNKESEQGTYCTSDSDESDQQEKLARPILTNPTPAGADDGSERSARAAAADPVSPEFYASEDRQILVRNIQDLAETHKAHGKDGPEYELVFETFESNLVTAFNEDDLLDHLLWDQNWRPTKIHADKYQAAKWLNKFLHTWTNEIGQLAWRGQTP